MSNMTSFQNQGDVGNQAGTQNIAGSVYNNSIIYESPHSSALRCPPGNHSADSDVHDNDILASLAFPQMLARRQDIEPPYANTCQWILERDEYRNWLEAPRGLLWIKGKPGAGKSTLMSFLYTGWERQRQTASGLHLDFFFSARGTELQRTPLGMIRSLVNQIFRYDEKVRPVIRQKYLDNCATYGYTHASWEWRRQELQTLFSAAVLDLAERQQVMLFIDALDEAGEQSAREIARYLHDINNNAVSRSVLAKICISCRHYPMPTGVRTTEIWVENHNGPDISAFISGGLEDSLACSDMSDVERRDLISSLIMQARGVFQWAYLVVPMVEKRIQDGESPEDLHGWLQQIPQELSDVYKHILQNVIEPRSRPQSFLLFQWVCLAEQPMSLTELRYAMVAKDAGHRLARFRCQEVHGFVRNDERMEQRVKALSGGLLEVSGGVGDIKLVQVIHQSVNDYILNHGLPLLELLQNDASTLSSAMKQDLGQAEVIGRCQANMYWSCLNYLVSEDFLPPDVPPDKLFTGETEELRIQFCQTWPWIAYAINLLGHAEKAAHYRQGDLEHQIELLRTVIPTWRAISRLLDPNDYELNFFDLETSLLHLAAAANMTDVVEGLLQVSNAVNVRDGNGRTAAHLAARHGHVEILEMLSHKGADLNVTANDGTTPFLAAAGYAQPLTIRWFIREATSTKESTLDLDSALREAAGTGDIAIVRIILSEGASVNAQGNKHGNALQTACYFGRADVARLLLQHGADVNAQGGSHGNALHIAYMNGHEDVIRLLLQHGANVNTHGGSYRIALRVACIYGRAEVVRLLLQNSPDDNAQEGSHGDALQAACRYGHEEVVRLLLQHSPDDNAQEGSHGNALLTACRYGQEKVIRILLQHGVDFGAYDDSEGNALQTACRYGQKEVVHLLLQHGSDINAYGGFHGNALSTACYYGNEEMVRLLLHEGAKVNKRGRRGTPLDVASEREFDKIVQILREHGGRHEHQLRRGYYTRYSSSDSD